MLRRIRRSVRNKLLLVMLAVVFVALSVTGTTLVIHEIRTYESRWVEDLTTQAEILGRSSVAALMFDDVRAAQENLSLLKVRPAILAAGVYDVRGAVFAEYDPEGKSYLPESVANLREGPRISGDHITLLRWIVENNERTGAVYLVARYELLPRIANYAGILAMAMALSLGVAMLIGVWLQKSITAPIAAV